MGFRDDHVNNGIKVAKNNRPRSLADRLEEQKEGIRGKVVRGKFQGLPNVRLSRKHTRHKIRID